MVGLRDVLVEMVEGQVELEVEVLVDVVDVKLPFVILIHSGL